MSTDVTNTSEYPDLVKTVETALNGEGLNLLVNSAGMLVDCSLEEVTEDIMIEHFKVNAIAPLLLVQVIILLLDDNRCASYSKIENNCP